MAEVKMNINEYNELRDELLLYKKVLSEILTPESISDWDIQWYKDHPEYDIALRSKRLPEMSKEAQALIHTIIHENVTNDIRKLGDIRLEYMGVDILKISHFQDDEEESNAAGDCLNDRS